MSVINTNVKALAAQASMSNVNKSMETAMERLSTGIRINSAKDDAAGLAIALRMTADIRGTAVAIRNANDAISLSQTAEGGLGQINDILQRMRELAVQSSNGTASADNRAASQLEISQLKQEIDTIASRTNFNGIKLLDGTAAKMTIQTGVNSGDSMVMQISAARTQDIGLGGRSSLTATGLSGTAGSLAKPIAAGDLTINGVAVGASSALDDNLSSGDKASSAIAKVAAINAVASQTGVVASIGKTVVSGKDQTAAALTGTITINGVATGSFSTTADAGVSRANSVAAINLITAQTGVRAVDTGDVKKGVQLIADDGRNITVAFTTLTDAATGVGSAGVTTASYQLTSTSGAPMVLGSSSNGTIANAGLVAGTFEANTSTVTSVSRAVGATAVAPTAATTGILEAGTMRINGIAIDAAVSASDTASDTQATSSTKSASAIAIAAAINAKTSLTGVTAKAEPNTIVGDTFTAAALAAKVLNINGVAVTLTTTTASTRGDVVSEINKVSGQTGVVASDNGRGLTLTAADGRNISLSSDSGGAEANYGLKSGSALMTVGTKANAVTTYAAVTLKSDQSFSVEGGSDGNASFEKLGFKTGTVGGSNNGVKVANVDVSTMAGAQIAITALDAAMKTVSMSQAQLGAYQNRLDSAIANLTEGSTNMNASRSRVLDTDYAKESTNLAKAQIISQAATAMLAQANQSAQSVLALLK
ncbi:MAG: flagellin [Burkholderiales bacterium]|nr:flagellin [Burkholderiales bacterium]